MMKTALSTILLVALLGCSKGQEEFNSYGSEITSGEALTTSEFLSLVSEEKNAYKVRGTIEEVCQMKGCWMTLKNPDGLNVRVTFKDYAFFVPKDIHEQEVIIEGIASKEVIDEDEARHYAEDGNVAYQESMRNTISFVASGVLVAKN